jgi:mono/diheme cytochrome c family protein
MCHGLEAMSGGVIPDLRYASKETFSQWRSIVIGGVRSEQGMRSFAEVLSPEDADATRAYVANRAAKLR